MRKVKVQIEGISPLLMHRYGTAEGNKKSKRKDQTQTRDDVESYLYRDEHGGLVQPSDHIIGALKKAGAKFQITGQGKLTYKNIMGSGAIVIDPFMIPHEQQKWEVDCRPVVVQRQRIPRSRPKLNNWGLSFIVEYDEDEIPIAVLKEIFDYAGRRVGIGDFRPANGGSFGRFHITEFKEM